MALTYDDVSISATRTDADRGIKETVEFFGTGPHRLFGTRSVPSDSVGGGLVVCSSLHAEMLNAYRREVLLSRALAGRGVAVQRFHYRGQGHSEGAPSETTFDRMVEDSVNAAVRLRETTRVTRPAFLGTRLGAIVAAAAVAHFPGAPLVLWDPVAEGARFFKDAFRASMMSDVKEQSSEHRTIDGQMATMDREGFVDVLGYAIHRALYESATTRNLAEELGPEPRPIFIGQIGRSDQLRPEYRRIVDAWIARGFSVRVEILRQDEISWFLTNERRLQESRQPLADASMDWIADAVADVAR